MKKLPRIDAIYWAFIISCTTIGETAGDLISQTTGLGYGASTAILIGLFFVALGAELFFRTQHAVMYWTVIMLASIAGTTLSDYLARELKLGYPITTAIVGATLAIVLVSWRLTARSMDLKAAFSRRVELLYWLAILSSSTLGTVFGDLISNATASGAIDANAEEQPNFLLSTLCLVVPLIVVGLLALFTKFSRMTLYWLGIVITHPLGATLGDYMTKETGLNLGNVKATLILVGVFVVVVIVGWVVRRKSGGVGVSG